tara:strand:- start:56 stop:241 length:186 start_codon:yes stop_codon:yes gene_type:complete
MWELTLIGLSFGLIIFSMNVISNNQKRQILHQKIQIEHQKEMIEMLRDIRNSVSNIPMFPD